MPFDKSRFVYLIIVSLFLTSGAIGGLPELSQKEVASLIEGYQNKLTCLQVKHQIAFGITDRGNFESEFVPHRSRLTVDANYAVDFKQGVSHLLETVRVGGKTETKEVAFDGTLGTLLWPRTANGNYLGEVVQGMPSQLAVRGANNWRPDRAAYWGIPDHNLASAIRGAKKFEIAVEPADGVECYKINLLMERTVTKEYEGKDLVGYEYEKYALWLDPSRGMLPRKTEIYSNAHPHEGGAGKLTGIARNIEFEQVAPGIWFPMHSRLYVVRGSKPKINTVDMVIRECKLNESTIVDGRVQFPPGCHVTDEAKGVKYVVGLTKEHIDMTVDEVMSTLKQYDEGRTEKETGDTGLTEKASEESSSTEASLSNKHQNGQEASKTPMDRKTGYILALAGVAAVVYTIVFGVVLVRRKMRRSLGRTKTKG